MKLALFYLLSSIYIATSIRLFGFTDNWVIVGDPYELFDFFLKEQRNITLE